MWIKDFPKIKQVHPQKFQGIKVRVVAPDRPVCHTGEAPILEFSCNEPLKFKVTLLLILYISKTNMSVVTQCKLKYIQDSVNSSHEMASVKMILYARTYPTKHWCKSLPSTFIILGPRIKVNIQYANLEDKEITKISHLLWRRYITTVMYQSIPKPPIPPPRAIPGHLTRVKLRTVGNLT